MTEKLPVTISSFESFFLRLDINQREAKSVQFVKVQIKIIKPLDLLRIKTVLYDYYIGQNPSQKLCSKNYDNSRIDAIKLQ